MDRRITEKLLAWKQAPDRKPLVLLGARQVGKTWMMRHFGEQHYDHVAYVNCDGHPLAKRLFVQDYNMERILLTIHAITGVPVEPGRTLIILDELQEAERGLHSLKYFREDAPQYHVMAAGSLLGITLGHGQNFPVGKVTMLDMHPMDFGEFLLAMGEEPLVNLLNTRRWDVIDLMAERYEHLLRLYYYVGGMPEVVAGFVAERDLTAVRKRQMDILKAYRNDVSKHTSSAESVRIGQVIRSLPSQLSKENKKFMYSVIRKGARAAEYELAIQWLLDAGLAHRVPRVSEMITPISFYEDLLAFKLFFVDCGLLAALANVPADTMIAGDGAFAEFKGAFTEQYVLQQLVAQGYSPCYWSKDNSQAEVDFVVQTEASVTPIEVKAEANVRSRSMADYIKAHPQLQGVRLSMRAYIDQGWMRNVPLWAAAQALTCQEENA